MLLAAKSPRSGLQVVAIPPIRIKGTRTRGFHRINIAFGGWFQGTTQGSVHQMDRRGGDYWGEYEGEEGFMEGDTWSCAFPSFGLQQPSPTTTTSPTTTYLLSSDPLQLYKSYSMSWFRLLGTRHHDITRSLLTNDNTLLETLSSLVALWETATLWGTSGFPDHNVCWKSFQEPRSVEHLFQSHFWSMNGNC